MEQPRRIVSETRDAVRRTFSRRTLDLFRIFLDLLDQGDFRLIDEPRKLGCVARLDSSIGRLAEDARNACVRILDIVDGILVGMRLRKVEIEVELTVQ